MKDKDYSTDNLPDLSDEEIEAAADEFVESVHLGAPVDERLVEAVGSETKALADDETFGLRPDELELPPRVDDPHGMAFTDEEIEALTATDNEAAKALAFATATPEKRALLKAKD